MKQAGVLVILLGIALPILPQSSPGERVVRQHRRVTLPNKDVFEWSELVYSGEVDGVVSLWRAPSGEMLIFRQSDVYKKGTMNFSVSDPSHHIFVQAVVHLPYGGNSAAEAKRALQDVPPAAYARAPLTFAIGSYHSAARLETWHSAEGASRREDVRHHLDDSTLRMIRKQIIAASGVGSVAAGAVCNALLDILTEGAESGACTHDRKMQPELSGPDCDFDAKFGYPCVSVAPR